MGFNKSLGGYVRFRTNHVRHSACGASHTSYRHTAVGLAPSPPLRLRRMISVQESPDDAGRSTRTRKLAHSASPSTGSVLPVARARLRRQQGRVMLFLALRFVCSALWPNWTYQIRPPDGAGLIHRALRFQESRAVAAQDPDTGIWWLLPHQWRQCYTDASDVNFDDIPYGLLAGAAGRERIPAFGGNRKFHKQGLRRRYYHGDGR